MNHVRLEEVEIFSKRLIALITKMFQTKVKWFRDEH